ncbi:MAG: hypothetical protein JWN16_517 [Alphaproteobacteria bacterium]|nr:hypothetical protein [Alphaproteobacteria bacterium]
MSSIKNPDHEAEKPASTPEGHKAKMAPLAEAPAGLEQDGKGNVIPLPQRTKDDQEKARTGNKD